MSRRLSSLVLSRIRHNALLTSRSYPYNFERTSSSFSKEIKFITTQTKLEGANLSTSNLKIPWKHYHESVDELKWKFSDSATGFAQDLLASQPVDHDGVEVTSFSKDRVLPIYDFESMPYLFTRKDSRELVGQLIDSMTKAKSTRNAIIYGNPGIGKSVGCLLYALTLLLKLNKLVYYHYIKSGWVVVFVPPQFQEQVDNKNYKAYILKNANDLISEISGLENPDSFYLVDVGENTSPKLVAAHTIIASSPDFEKLKDHEKALKTQQYFLPMWKLNELKSLFNRYPNFLKSDYTLEEKFNNVNGNLSAILDDVSYLKEVNRQKENVGNPNTFSKLYNAVFDSAKLLYQPDRIQSVESTTLFCYSAVKPYHYENISIHVKSRYIMDNIMKNNYENEYLAARLKPNLWEKFCILTISCGGDFDVWDYDNMSNLHVNAIKVNNIHNKSNLATHWKNLPLSGSTNDLSPPVLLCSDHSNFPLVDFVTYKDVVYNPTIKVKDKDEKIPSAETVISICNLLQIDRLNLYHCVPQENFNSWMKSAIPKIRAKRKSTKADVEKANSLLKHYVIKIPRHKS